MTSDRVKTRGTDRQLERIERTDDAFEHLQAPTPSARLNQSHEDSHLLSHHHLHRSNADMESQDSLSRPKKKVKDRLTEGQAQTEQKVCGKALTRIKDRIHSLM